jgi:hypothetical protein
MEIKFRWDRKFNSKGGNFEIDENKKWLQTQIKFLACSHSFICKTITD